MTTPTTPPTFSATLDAEKLRRAMKEAEKKLDDNMQLAMSQAVDLVSQKARDSDAFEDQEGELRNSIDGVVEGRFASGSLEGIVSAGAPHGIYIEEGTDAHTIKPRHRKALRWEVEGGFRFAKQVNHPGTEARPFLKPAAEENIGDITAEFQAAVDLAFDDAGL